MHAWWDRQTGRQTDRQTDRQEKSGGRVQEKGEEQIGRLARKVLKKEAGYERKRETEAKTTGKTRIKQIK